MKNAIMIGSEVESGIGLKWKLQNLIYQEIAMEWMLSQVNSWKLILHFGSVHGGVNLVSSYYEKKRRNISRHAPHGCAEDIFDLNSMWMSSVLFPLSCYLHEQSMPVESVLIDFVHLCQLTDWYCSTPNH